MPYYGEPPKQFRPGKLSRIEYKDFSGGWNSIFRPTELKPNELAQATNLVLTGRGVPTGRWGSENYFLAGQSRVRHLTTYLDPYNSVNDLLAITDDGYLVKKSGASYALVAGASFASGYPTDSAQLGGFTYFVGGNSAICRYNGTNLGAFTQIPAPTGVAVSNVSGATGVSTWSWRITAKTLTGETTGSVGVSFASLPLDLSQTLMNIKWSRVTGASGGYSIYRGLPGDETFIDSVGPDTVSYLDYGSPQSDFSFPPNANNTGGINCKYMLRFDDRLIISGVADDPTVVWISGRYPYQDRYNWADGGGYIRIAPNSGDVVTGLGISGAQTQGGSTPASILVFMKNSVHQLVLKTATIGNYVILDPQVQELAPTGCSSHDTIQQVQNNSFYFGRQGLFTIGQEQAYLQQIRTREISARIRPYVQGLSDADFNNAVSGYIDYKYLLSFPGKKETIVYDFERACFMGPWQTPYGITAWLRYFDSVGREKWLAGADDGYVKEFNEVYKSDSGTAIRKILRTRKEDFGNWSTMKVVNTLYVLFRNVSGSVSVNIRLEERGGTEVTSKSFNITGSIGNAGWGTSGWGTKGWGLSQNSVSLTGEEIIRWAQLYKTARVLQVEVVSNNAVDQWEFLGVRSSAKELSEGSLSSATRV